MATRACTRNILILQTSVYTLPDNCIQWVWSKGLNYLFQEKRKKRFLHILNPCVRTTVIMFHISLIMENNMVIYNISSVFRKNLLINIKSNTVYKIQCSLNVYWIITFSKEVRFTVFHMEKEIVILFKSKLPILCMP